MRKFGLLALLVSLMALVIPVVVYAQDAAAPAAPAAAAEDNTEYGYGTVVSVDDGKKEIVISEYDWETDAEANVTYSVSQDAKFENVAALKNIQAGSYVDVEYVPGEGGKRIAKLISVYEPEAEEAPMAETAPAAAPAAPVVAPAAPAQGAAAPAAPAPAAPAPAEKK